MSRGVISAYVIWFWGSVGLKEAGIWREKVDKNSRRYVRLLGSGKIWSSPSPHT